MGSGSSAQSSRSSRSRSTSSVMRNRAKASSTGTPPTRRKTRSPEDIYRTRYERESLIAKMREELEETDRISALGAIAPPLIEVGSWQDTIQDKLLSVLPYEEGFLEEYTYMEESTEPEDVRLSWRDLNDAGKEYVSKCELWMGHTQNFFDAFLSDENIFGFQDVARDMEEEMKMLRMNDPNADLAGRFSAQDLQSMWSRNARRLNQALTQSVPVKLFMTPIVETQGFGHYWQRTLSFLGMFNNSKYGAFHAGLRVGDYIFDWNQGSLVEVKSGFLETLIEIDLHQDTPWYKKLQEVGQRIGMGVVGGAVLPVGLIVAAVTAGQCVTPLHFAQGLLRSTFMEVGAIEKEKLVHLAELCVTYNRYYHYSVIKRNCQHFVDDALEKLGITVDFNGEMDAFLTRVRTYGFADMRFRNIPIENRADLDRFLTMELWRGYSHEDRTVLRSYALMFRNRRKAVERGENNNFVLGDCVTTLSPTLLDQLQVSY